MNTYTPEHLIATNKANVQALAGLGNNVFAGIEKLAELNFAASKAMMTESFDNMQNIMGAKDPSEFLALQTGSIQSLVEKSTAYGKHVVAIVTESGAELTEMIEGNVAQAQKGFSALVENMAKNAPAGSEAAVALFKNTLSASQNAIESAQKTAKSAMTVAESNYSAMAEQAAKATKSATKKA